MPKSTFLPLGFNHKVTFDKVVNNNCSYSDNQFSFLNLDYRFDKEIDWNYNLYGKLFTYNITYFDYLNQEPISQQEGLSLLHKFVDNYRNLRDGHEAYPTSLRIINVIKFVASYDINDPAINELVAKDFFRLKDNIEFHLLGNHLLENYFALSWASIFLNEKDLSFAVKLVKELNNQVLNDGGHFERSPMYHQLVLFRVLDTIQLFSKNHIDKELESSLRNIASKMLGWLNNITLQNGDIPLSNDSAFNINPTTEELNNYGNKLRLVPEKLDLNDSNFRMFRKGKLELFVNIGNIQATYQPGHAHADHLTFDLCFGEKTIVTDTGISTYENNSIRHYERSTSAHNTVVVKDENSSDVWSAFRVAKRAKATVIKEKEGFIQMSQDGYARLGCIHTRSFAVESNVVAITDVLDKPNKAAKAIFHFHPDQKLVQHTDERARFTDFTIDFQGGIAIQKNYFYAPEFNKRLESISLEVSFESKLTTIISFK